MTHPYDIDFETPYETTDTTTDSSEDTCEEIIEDFYDEIDDSCTEDVNIFEDAIAFEPLENIDTDDIDDSIDDCGDEELIEDDAEGSSGEEGTCDDNVEDCEIEDARLDNSEELDSLDEGIDGEYANCSDSEEIVAEENLFFENVETENPDYADEINGEAPTTIKDENCDELSMQVADKDGTESTDDLYSSEIKHRVDTTDISTLTQEEAQHSLMEYLGRNNYSPDDFDTYSQDPEWRELMGKAFPDTKLPEIIDYKENVDCEFQSVAEYFGAHEYTEKDFDTYSQDPIWRELMQKEFPNYVLPALKNAQNSEIVESSSLNDIKECPKTPNDSVRYRSIVNQLETTGVEYIPIPTSKKALDAQEIINELGGPDSAGSCSSLAFAYAGNKAGFTVRDFRGNKSRHYFSQNSSIEKIARLPGVESKIVYGHDDIACSKELMKQMEAGKEYYFASGCHAAIIRKLENDNYEFLEMQKSSCNNGWKKLDNFSLITRFDCVRNNNCILPNFLINVDSLSKNQEFLNILGFINTNKT